MQPMHRGLGAGFFPTPHHHHHHRPGFNATFSIPTPTFIPTPIPVPVTHTVEHISTTHTSNASSSTKKGTSSCNCNALKITGLALLALGILGFIASAVTFNPIIFIGAFFSLTTGIPLLVAGSLQDI